MKIIMAEGLRLLLLLLSLAIVVNGKANNNYIIIPSNEACASCPLDVNVSCLTIQQFTIETNNITDGDDVQHVVLPGNHSLYTDLLLMYINSLTSMPSSSDPHAPVRINCYGSMARIQISTLQSVHISGLKFCWMCRQYDTFCS